MQKLLDSLSTGKVLVADGAMGTMLFKRGLKPGDCPEKMNLEHPEALEEIAYLYLKAGADIIQTNTFGGSSLKLSQYALEDKTEAINIAGVRAARHAIDSTVYLSASCGPSGRLLKPYGDTEPNVVRQGFERQLRAIAGEGVELICIETMTDLAEAELAVRAAKAVAPEIPVAATMTFDETPKGFFTIMGTTIEKAAESLTAAGADIIGSNCGNGIENMIEIAAEFKQHTAKPILIQSNAGLPQMQGDTLQYPESAEFMADRCRALLEIGVNIIGGCCGTTPAHTAAIRLVVDEFNRARQE